MKIFKIILFLAIIGVAGYLYFTRPVSAPSESIENVVVNLPDSSETENEPGTSTTAKTYSIVSADSKAEFTLNEELQGKPTKVVGTTNQIGGEISLDMANPKSMQIGEIKVNARTLKTDKEKRDGAIGRFILKSEEAENEFITFKTTSITGLPATIEADKEFTFQITGDLKIKGVTKSKTWNAKGKVNSKGTFTATADTKFAYADFGITVPEVEFVANVDEEVTLMVSIVAMEK